MLPDPLGPSSGWLYLPAFATSPELLDVLTHWAVTRLVISKRTGMQR
jgi:hypothetical protein